MTRSLSNQVSCTEKKKALCSKKHEMHVCLQFEVAVLCKHDKKYVKYRQHLQGTNFTKLSPNCIHYQRIAVLSSAIMQPATPGAEQPCICKGTGTHPRVSLTKAGKGFVPILSNFLFATNPLLCTLLHDARYLDGGQQETPTQSPHITTITHQEHCREVGMGVRGRTEASLLPHSQPLNTVVYSFVMLVPR